MWCSINFKHITAKLKNYLILCISQSVKIHLPKQIKMKISILDIIYHHV